MPFLLGTIFLLWLLLGYGWAKVAVGFGAFVLVCLPVALLLKKESAKNRRGFRRHKRGARSRSPMLSISLSLEGDEELSPLSPSNDSRTDVVIDGVATKVTAVRRGIIIRAEHLQEILAGHKSWEMRSKPFRGRETIGLIQKGSKAVYGVAEVIDCMGPLSREDLNAAYDRHRIRPHEFDDPRFSKYKYAWVLANITRLRYPIPYVHRSGQVIFVSFDAETSNAIVAAM
jgi:hypothetical protein